MNDIDAFYSDLGRRIQAARSDLGITQSDLAKAFGLTRSSIANIEAGRQRSPLHTIVEMAALLGFEIPGLRIGPSPIRLGQANARKVQEECRRLRAGLETVYKLAHDMRWPPPGESAVS